MIILHLHQTDTKIVHIFQNLLRKKKYLIQKYLKKYFNTY